MQLRVAKDNRRSRHHSRQPRKPNLSEADRTDAQTLLEKVPPTWARPDRTHLLTQASARRPGPLRLSPGPANPGPWRLGAQPGPASSAGAHTLYPSLPPPPRLQLQVGGLWQPRRGGGEEPTLRLLGAASTDYVTRQGDGARKYVTGAPPRSVLSPAPLPSPWGEGGAWILSLGC
jgi:hypothetical protein